MRRHNDTLARKVVRRYQPSLGAWLPLEGSDDLVRDLAAVVAAWLRQGALIVHEAGIQEPRIDGDAAGERRIRQ